MEEGLWAREMPTSILVVRHEAKVLASQSGNIGPTTTPVSVIGFHGDLHDSTVDLMAQSLYLRKRVWKMTANCIHARGVSRSQRLFWSRRRSPRRTGSESQLFQ
jgi:hypothetical protein